MIQQKDCHSDDPWRKKEMVLQPQNKNRMLLKGVVREQNRALGNKKNMIEVKNSRRVRKNRSWSHIEDRAERKTETRREKDFSKLED